jgi:hypothetical protein
MAMGAGKQPVMNDSYWHLAVRGEGLLSGIEFSTPNVASWPGSDLQAFYSPMPALLPIAVVQFQIDEVPELAQIVRSYHEIARKLPVTLACKIVASEWYQLFDRECHQK